MVYFRLIASHLTSHVFCYLIIQAQGNQLEKSQAEREREEREANG